MAKAKNKNPEAMADIGRQFIEAARKVEPAQLMFVLDLVQMIEAVKAQEPDRAAAMRQFAEARASQYKLQTAEGQAAFIDALQAL